jgi:hypothetical protein
LSPSCEKERTRKSTPLDENVVEEVLLQRRVLVMKWSEAFIFLFVWRPRKLIIDQGLIKVSLRVAMKMMKMKRIPQIQLVVDQLGHNQESESVSQSIRK